MIELLIAFIAGVIASRLLGLGLERRGRHPKPLRAGLIPARVIGVYSTVHSDKGDFDTGGPESVVVDGEIVTFNLLVPRAPFDCDMHSNTIHAGIHSTKVRFEPPVHVRKGDRLIVVQSVGWLGLEAGGPMPEWVQTEA